MATSIRTFIESLLAERGSATPVGDDEALFTSGRLDSMAAVQVMMMLESDYGFDLSDADFDIARLDTIADLEGLIARRQAA